MIEVTENPIWIGPAVGKFPAYQPVVFQRENGFEPGHLCQLGGSLWVSEVPYRCATLADAIVFISRFKLAPPKGPMDCACIL